METFIATIQNFEESICDFLLAQQSETKKLLDYEINFIGDFNFYINEIIFHITDDSASHSASKLLLSF